jgi:hypothetical protein
MTEDEVNRVVEKWLISQGYKYKGVNKTRKLSRRDKHSDNNVGQVPVPDGYRQVLIDHQGIMDNPIDLLWVEAKGSNTGMSQLLEGFIRMAYAVYHGGGKGILATPTIEYQQIKEQEGFLRAIAIASDKSLGLLNAETYCLYWLEKEIDNVY